MSLVDLAPRAASSAGRRLCASAIVARAATALALALLVACRADTPTQPNELKPTRPLFTLTGGVGTPLFPTAPPGEAQGLGYAIALNASGQVTGGVAGLPGTVDGNKPFRWTRSTGVALLTTCCENGFGADINTAGAVAGSVEAGPNAVYRAFVATGNSISLLPTLPGLSFDQQESNAQALALNDAGQIVGFSPAPNANPFALTTHAVLWSASGQITDLGTLGGTNSQAVDINDAGQVIGTSGTAGDAATHAFLWTSGTGMQDLTTILGATILSVVAINDAGQIVGTYLAPNGQSHAFRYTPGSPLLDLGTLGGQSSEPTGLNEKGEVVGSSSGRAFLWTPADGMEDITATAGILDVRGLNDNLQTLTVTAPPTGTPTLGQAIPRLVQLQVTQSNVPPTAVFTYTCNGLTCSLDATGSLDDKPGLTYAWDLGKYPGGSATGPTVTVTYPHAGTRTVRLTVTDAQGLTSSYSQNIPIADFPFAAFTYSCTGLTCSFDSSGSVINGTSIIATIWYFGDGQIGYNLGAPTHTFAQSGTYDVKLEILTGPGTTPAIVIQRVTVTAPANLPPVASFDVTCRNYTCVFDASGSTDDKGIATYSWNLDRYPGGTATGVTTTTTYPHAGPRNVTLTVTDAGGLSSSSTQTFDPVNTAPTNAPPVARFTATCSGTVCTLDASSSGDDGGIVSYVWNLGKSPGGSASGLTVTTDYWHSGPRTVTLTVADAAGLTDTITQTVNVP